MNKNSIERMREGALSSFTWKTRQKHSAPKNGFDVMVSKRGAKDGTRYSVAISFKDNLQELITDERIAFAVVKNRMFFKCDANGFKLREESNRKAFTSKWDEEEAQFLGGHSLKYDDFLDLYYIEAGENS